MKLPTMLVAALMAAAGLDASEYQGTVQSAGLPVPGASVTATRNDKSVSTTTDERGAFRFADLADGVWKVEVRMLGFAPLVEEVGVAPVTPSPAWELKLLSEPELQASLRRAAVTPTATTTGVPANPTKAANAESKPSAQTGFQPWAPGATPTASTATKGARGASGPSGYQRLDVNQSTSILGSEGSLRSDEMTDLTQSAANSFVVQGSMSSAIGLGQQNDWRLGGGPPMGFDPMMLGLGGPGGGGPGMGGPGMMGMMGGPGGDGPSSGPGGRGGMMMAGGGPGGGGPGGRAPGGGGPGGPGGGPGAGGPGMGGPGGMRGERGGRDREGWQGRPNAMAFGNNRRDPRRSYNGSLNLGFNNSVWDARTFSVTGAAVDKPSYSDLRGGFMFGGPLQIPKLVSVEKRVFFMVNFMFDRSRTGAISQPVNMPTALERTGDFSQSQVQGAAFTIYDPTTGLPFPGNKIPTTRLNATSLALLQYYPLPNLTDASRNYQTSWTGRTSSNMFNTRLSNIKLTSKDRLDGGVGYMSRNTTTPNLFQFIDSGEGRGVNANLGWSHNFSTRVINNLRYTFSRSRDQATPYFAYQQNVAAALGIQGTSQNPMNWGPPNLSFTNYGGLTDGAASLNRNQTGAVSDSLLYVRGSHNFTFGGDYRRQQFNQFSDQNGRGSYSFNGYATSLLANGVAQSGTGYDLADFLLGTPSTSSIRYGNPDKYFRGSGYSLFTNDDWRITTKFTLVTGVRWDYTTPVTELYSRLANLSIAPGFTAVTLVQPGASLGQALINPDRNNFSPRFGFALRPLTNGSLVIRGGYGIYYNTSIYNMIASNMAQQPPYAQTLSVAGTAANPLNILTGFLGGTAVNTLSTYAIDPNYRVGYAQTWNLTVQHNLPWGMFGTVGYLGTKGTRLDQQFLPNSVAPGATASTLPTGYTYQTSNGNSIYHAAQFQLNRRFRSGFMANTSYQFSKSIDNAGTGGRGQGGTPVAQNWLDLAAERGLSTFDGRHNLNINFQYSSGMGRSGGTLIPGWKGALLKDWTVGGSVSVRSGSPLTATVGGNRSQVAGTAVSNTVRANATGLPVSVEGMLFNTEAFSTPAAGEWGNAGRHTIPGPTTFFLNGQVGRVFRLGERRSVDLQFQAQNLLNHVTITSWGTVLGSTNYGLATGAAQMRKITANLRFRF
jgi:hypothetical protein